MAFRTIKLVTVLALAAASLPAAALQDGATTSEPRGAGPQQQPYSPPEQRPPAPEQQQAPSYAPPAQAQPQIPKVSDREARHFAAAAKKVMAIRAEVQQKVGANSSQSKLMQAQQKAQQKMIAAVKQEGLTPQRYNQIQLAMQTDRDLAKKIQRYLKQQ